ncbi:hypothetical protein KFK09_007094 [Dendrobium nobile]|uniref:DUF4283 domain-containing protein n=1 Tax=Dendrobium nobile TaxID=94219 RepID=A0A8T3BT53_DENNO|nr:hypothetical protein KFK09_007094 [Dendrobium nobile]
MIKEGGLLKNKVIPMVTGKGKEIFKEDDVLRLKNFKTVTGFKEMMENFKGEASTSAVKTKFKTLSLPTTSISCKIVESAPDGIIKANMNKVIEEFPLLADKQGNGDETVNFSNVNNGTKNVNSAWSKRQNIWVDKLDLGSFLSEDGNTVKLYAENENINAKKLDCALVVKLFGDNLMFSSFCNELRKQWGRFGKFHITGLGTGWVLWSFENPESMEEVMTGSPYYVKGHVVGLDKWIIGTPFKPRVPSKQFFVPKKLISSNEQAQLSHNDALKNDLNTLPSVEEVEIQQAFTSNYAKSAEDKFKMAQKEDQAAQRTKSLGDGNIVKHNRKLESGRNKKVGLSGGILVLWRKGVADFSVLEVSSQVIIGNLENVNKGGWQVSTAYGGRSMVDRKSLWEILEKRCDNNKPTVIGGDFTVSYHNRRKEAVKKKILSQGAIDMEMFMNNNDLHEVGLIGPKFTWCNNKSGGSYILERLDRCLINSYAMNSINLALVKHLSRIASDHCPILLELFKPVIPNYKCIRFEDVWCTYHGAFAIVANTCKKGGGNDLANALNLKFKRTLKALFYWSKAKFKSLNVLRDTLKKEIYDLQIEEADGMLSEKKLMLLRSKVNELNCVLARLNIWWRQRAKARWLEEGDTNSAFFHSFANARRSANWINLIKNEDGTFTDQIKDFDMIFTKFFKAKWSQRTFNLDGWPQPAVVLDKEDQLKLDADFSKEELQEVVNNLGKNIAPGMDGITFSFIKCYWEHGMESFEARCGKNEDNNHIAGECDKLKKLEKLSYKNPLVVNIYCNAVFLVWKSKNLLIHEGREDNDRYIAVNAISMAAITPVINVQTEN